MRCDVVAVGTELLLGQIVDTNSAWMGERLAAAGIDSLMQTKVGDNQARIVSALRDALERADAVICCGGLGPTQDDITRESIAELMGVALERDAAMVASVRAMFDGRGRVMPESNQRQADRPVGAEFIVNHRGTAPGLICVIGDKVLYAVPGVPHEMQAMVDEVIVADLVRRSGESAVIASRVLRIWGAAESAIAEMVAPRLVALDAPGAPAATIAFLASGMEGIKVRITAKATTRESVDAILDTEEQALRAILGRLVFGVDDDSMERVVAQMLVKDGLTLAVAESLTGGLVSSRLVGVPGASAWFKGAVVSYASEVKFDVLGVANGPVVSAPAAIAMAEGVRDRLRADVGLGVTGVAGPDEQEGHPVGTVFVGLALPGQPGEAVELRLPGDREAVRQYAAIGLLDLLRLRLSSN